MSLGDDGPAGSAPADNVPMVPTLSGRPQASGSGKHFKQILQNYDGTLRSTRNPLVRCPEKPLTFAIPFHRPSRLS